MFLDNLVISLTTLYNNPVAVAVLTLFLGIATVTDVKHLKIPDKLNGAFFALRIILIPLIGFQLHSIMGAVLGFFFLLIPAMIRMHKMGGDIKCMTVVGFYVGAYITPVFVALTCLFGALFLAGKYLVVKKTGVMPFAPFFLMAHLALWGVTHWLL